MKVDIQKEDRTFDSIETRRIYVYDNSDIQFEIILNGFGGIEIRKTDGAISIHPSVSNCIVLK